MTAETDLLPLPEGYAAWAYIGSTRVYSADGMESYARANVSHAAAPLQAEVEALRAEVAEWKRVAAAQAELHNKAESRAGRLAEALRLAEEHISDLTPEWYNSGQRVLAAIRAARKQEDV